MRIGLLLSRSGPTGLWTQGCEAAAMLAAAELNLAGGVLDQPVELVVADAGPGTESATRAARVLAGQSDAVVGLQPSHMRFAVQRGLEGRVPYIYTPQYEGGFCGPGTISLGLTDWEVLAPAIAWLAEHRRARRFAFVGNAYVWPKVALGSARSAVAAAGGVMEGESFLPFGTEDYAPLLDRLRGLAPDVVVTALLGDESVRFHRAFGEAGLDRRILRLGLAVDETLLWGIAPQNAGNLFAVQTYFDSCRGRIAADVAARYESGYGQSRPPLNALSLGCHDGVRLAAALARRERSTAGRGLARLAGRRIGRAGAFALLDPPETARPVQIAEADGTAFRLCAVI